MKTKEEIKKEIEALKWKHNKTKEAKELAGTFARYNYESLVDEHNKEIDEAVKFTEQHFLDKLTEGEEK